MKAIFGHFSIPETSKGVIYQLEWSNISIIPEKLAFLGVEEIVSRLINPIIFLKVLGFPLFFLIGICGLIFLVKNNLMKKNFVLISLKYINNHFKEIHPNIMTAVVNEKKGKNINFKINESLTFLFLALAMINLGGMINGTWCTTTWFSGTIGLSLTIWILTLCIRVYNYIVLFLKNTKMWEGEELLFLAGFFPAGTPLWLAPLMIAIEILSWIIRFLSMGLRIAGNLVAGHVILGILTVAYLELNKIITFELINIKFSINIIAQMAYSTLMYLELAVAIIQAYVLTLLTSTFLKEIEEIH